MNEKEIIKMHEDKASKFLVGKKIKAVYYMTDKEKSKYYWSRKALVIEFTDGSYILPSRDSEGNDAATFFTSSKDCPVIPSI